MLLHKILFIVSFSFWSCILIYSNISQFLFKVVPLSIIASVFYFILSLYEDEKKVDIIFSIFMVITISILYVVIPYSKIHQIITFIFSYMMAICSLFLPIVKNNVKKITICFLISLLSMIFQEFLSIYAINNLNFNSKISLGMILLLFECLTPFLLLGCYFFFRKRKKRQLKNKEKRKIQKEIKNDNNILGKNTKYINFRDLAYLWTETQTQNQQSSINNTENIEEQKKQSCKIIKIPHEELQDKKKEQKITEAVCGDKDNQKIMTETEEDKNKEEKKQYNNEIKEKSPTIDSIEEKINNNYVLSIYNTFIKNIISSKDFLKVIECLLLLLEEGGNESSVSSLETEDEETSSSMITNSFDVYSQISLAEHTYNVCSEMLNLVKEEFSNTWTISWPSALIVALAHDLGKASSLANKVPIFYGSHANVSTELFLQCADSLPPKIAQNLGAVISYHHGKCPDNFTEQRLLTLLKKADSNARKKEMKDKLGELKSWKDINVSDLAKKMYNALLEITKEGQVKSCPYTIHLEKGLLFINPGLFYSCLKKVIEENNIYWPEFFSQDDTEKAKAIKEFITAKLSPSGWLPTGNISPGRNRYFKIFNVEINGREYGRKPFIPFILNSFCKSAGHESFHLVQKFQESPLKSVFVILKN